MIYDKPHQKVLNKDLRLAEVENYRKGFTEVIEDLVAFGTWVILESYNSINKEYELALPVLYNSQIELLDSLGVNCSQAVCSPSQIINRSILENYFYIRYIRLDETKYKSRSKAFIYYNYRELLKLQNAMEKDQKKELTEMKDIFDEHKALDLEIRSTKKRIKRHPQWYSLYDGPKSYVDLMKHVCEKAYGNEPEINEYHQLLYSLNSLRVHSTDAFFRVNNSNGETQINAIRTFDTVEEFKNCYSLPIRLSLYCTTEILKAFCSNAQKRAKNLSVNILKRLKEIEKLPPSKTFSV